MYLLTSNAHVCTIVFEMFLDVTEQGVLSLEVCPYCFQNVCQDGSLVFLSTN